MVLGSRSTPMRSNTAWHLAHMALASSRPNLPLSSLPMNMFSNTARSLTRFSSWWMKAMPADRESPGTRNSTCLPSREMVPRSAGSTPPKMFISVDFPAPFSPSRAQISPPEREKSMSFSTSLAPKDLVILRISSVIKYPPLSFWKKAMEDSIAFFFVHFSSFSSLPGGRKG